MVGDPIPGRIPPSTSQSENRGMPDTPPAPNARRARGVRRFRATAAQVRPVVSRDFFAWHDVFGASLEEHGIELTEHHALQVWQWIDERPARLEALVAEAEGAINGFVLFHEAVQPKSGDTVFVVDDLYVVRSARRNGVAGELIGAVDALANERGASGLRVEAGDDEEIAEVLQDRQVAPRRAVVHTLVTSTNGA